MTRFLRGVAFFTIIFIIMIWGYSYIADALLPEEQFQKINSPKDQLKKLTNLVLVLRIVERRERGEETHRLTTIRA